MKYLLIEKKVLNEDSLKNGLLAVKFICSLLNLFVLCYFFQEFEMKAKFQKIMYRPVLAGRALILGENILSKMSLCPMLMCQSFLCSRT